MSTEGSPGHTTALSDRTAVACLWLLHWPMAPACITFAQGTLTVRGLPKLPPLLAIPGVTWVSEAQHYHAPVRVYLALVSALAELGIRWADASTPNSGWLSEGRADRVRNWEPHPSGQADKAAL
ncbi:MAG TPA: hypothetical protein VGF45_15340 [Polyangia bacterium]